MLEPATILLTLGGVFLLGMVADLIGRRTPVPRVALLVGTGFVIGPDGLALLPSEAESWFPLVTDLALVMVGFLVGGYLSRANLAGHGRSILVASATVTIVTAIVVFTGSLILGLPPTLPPETRSSSEPYALLCAQTIRTKAGATWGLAETGAAGPTGNRYGDSAGHTCVAVSGAAEHVLTVETRVSDREANMWMFARAALELLERTLRA